MCLITLNGPGRGDHACLDVENLVGFDAFIEAEKDTSKSLVSTHPNVLKFVSNDAEAAVSTKST